MTKKTDKKVIFIQAAAPSLKAGEYTLDVTQSVSTTGPNAGSGDFKSDSYVFAVKGERFALQNKDLYGNFPPRLANGEFAGVLPQVVFNTLTLPWERSIESADGHLPVDVAEHTPWMAILTFDEGSQPKIQKLTAKDLVPLNKSIKVYGADTTGTGTMPGKYLSYPFPTSKDGTVMLDYSESPDDKCDVIDIPIELFSKIAPSVQELYYLGHIRKVETEDSEDHQLIGKPKSYAVVMGNRMAKVNVPCYPFLVSLELMSDYLPDSTGKPSAAIPTGKDRPTHIRLVTFRNWQYTANNLNQSFRKLLENLDEISGKTCSSGLRLPSDTAPPSSADVQTALGQQGTGKLTSENAGVLVQNALNQGYVPMNHELRHGGKTVSWYRGPLAPFHTQTKMTIPISCPDAANRFNPDSGLFDVSYGAAWQLGQLLALRNQRFATALYEWKRAILNSQVQAQEAALLNQKLKAIDAFQETVQQRTGGVSVADGPLPPPPIPDYVADWIGRLRLLCGVPFNYLVPDVGMLPPESIRFFYLDMAWIDTLCDGAFSIGRSTTAEERQSVEAVVAREGLAAGKVAMTKLRGQALSPAVLDTNWIVSGVILRSAVVSGWPRLNVNGYNSTAGDPADEIDKLRLARLGDNVLMCLFRGDVKLVAIHEAPEALHCGVEAAGAKDQCKPGVPYVTTLREVDLPTPGKQYLEGVGKQSPNACVPVRSADPQCLQIDTAVTNITNKLKNEFGQTVSVFTSAQFALEMIKGVSKVEFFNPPPKENPTWEDSCPDITKSYAPNS